MAGVMADQQGTLQSIGTILTAALRPLQKAFSGTEQFKGFMLRLGWRPTHPSLIPDIDRPSYFEA